MFDDFKIVNEIKMIRVDRSIVMCTTCRLETHFFGLPTWITVRLRYFNEHEVEPSIIEEAAIRFNPGHNDSFVVGIQLNTLHPRYSDPILDGLRKRRQEWIATYNRASDEVDLASGVAGLL